MAKREALKKDFVPLMIRVSKTTRAELRSKAKRSNPKVSVNTYVGNLIKNALQKSA